jgi:hypothetical protein
MVKTPRPDFTSVVDYLADVMAYFGSDDEISLGIPWPHGIGIGYALETQNLSLAPASSSSVP